MKTYKVIHQVSPTQFEIKNIQANSEGELLKQKELLGTTYDDIDVPGWQYRFYPCGKFVIQWRTNFDYGSWSYAMAYILYVDGKRGTRTVVDVNNDVSSLDAVCQLMNKYANYSAEDIVQLFDDIVFKLGLYHRLTWVRKDYDSQLESGYNNESRTTLKKNDFDIHCISAISESMETAVQLQLNTEFLGRVASRLIETEENSKAINDIKELLGHADKYSLRNIKLISKGRKGDDHAIGNYDFLRY